MAILSSISSRATRNRVILNKGTVVLLLVSMAAATALNPAMALPQDSTAMVNLVTVPSQDTAGTHLKVMVGMEVVR